MQSSPQKASQTIEVGESAEKFGAQRSYIYHCLKKENPVLAEGGRIHFSVKYFYPSQYLSYPSCTFSVLVTNWSRFAILLHIIFHLPFITSIVS